MNARVEVRTVDLIGKALNWAVAIVEIGEVMVFSGGRYSPPPGCVSLNEDDCSLWLNDGDGGLVSWSPSTDWNQGGPLIESYGVKLVMLDDCDEGVKPRWAAEAGAECAWESNPNCYMEKNGGAGQTPLAAACRAIVRAKLGETVMVPKEIVQ